MTTNPKPAETDAETMVDHIAKSLSDKDRVEYFRVIRHCRDLPENDEMLRILNILKILTQIMVQVPDRVVTERERLEELFTDVVRSLTHVVRSNKEYQTGLDERIRDLPGSILQGLNPADLASKINERLQQQLTTLELPKTSQALSTLASDVRKTTVDFKSAADALRREYSGATASAVESIAQMKSSITSAVEKVTASATELADAVERKYWGTTAIIAGLALLLGLALGLAAGGRL